MGPAEPLGCAFLADREKRPLSPLMRLLLLLLCCCLLQIEEAVLRNYARYRSVLQKPWYPSAQAQWTSGAASSPGRSPSVRSLRAVFALAVDLADGGWQIF